MSREKIKKITEINSMIADFMGWEKLEDNVYMVPNLYPMDGNSGETSQHASGFGFDCSIDWLAPVVNKFLSLSIIVVDDESRQSSQELAAIQTVLRSLRITQPVEDIYNEVAAAIQWHHDLTHKLEKSDLLISNF